MVWKPNVTVASVLERDGRFLLVEEETEYGICYNQPAGHLECGESLIDAVIRETLEETAYTLCPQCLIGVYNYRNEARDLSYLRFAFGGEISAHDPLRQLDDGILAAHWLTLDEILALQGQYRSPLVLRCIEDWLAGRRYPLDCSPSARRNDLLVTTPLDRVMIASLTSGGARRRERAGSRLAEATFATTPWLLLCVLLWVVPAATAEALRVCYNYGCLAEAEVYYSDQQLTQVRALLGVARNAAEEREKLSLAVGWLLGWAGQQTPIRADRGGNYADDGVYGRMDCIDHSTTGTRLLRLLETRGWLQFHRVLEPVQRVRYLFEVHYSAQVEVLEPAAADDAPETAMPAARYVVDSWFRDNGQPAVVMALPEWLDGGGAEESAGAVMIAGSPGDGSPNER